MKTGLYVIDRDLVAEFTRHAFPEGSVSEAMCDALEHPAAPDREVLVQALYLAWMDRVTARVAASPEEHCRVLADAVLVLLKDSAMTSAQPVDRERVAELLSNATRDLDYKQWETPHGMLPFADALIAAGLFGSLAQPVDREALRKLMRDALDAYVNLGPQGYYVYVDSIATLLAGEQEQVET